MHLSLLSTRHRVVGMAIGAAIGAGTGMWWMMGVLGGTFPGFAKVFTRPKH